MVQSLPADPLGYQYVSRSTRKIPRKVFFLMENTRFNSQELWRKHFVDKDVRRVSNGENMKFGREANSLSLGWGKNSIGMDR